MINKLIKLFVVASALLLTGSCTQLNWSGKKGEFHEKYTVIYESAGQKPILPIVVEEKPQCVMGVIELQLPPPVPVLTEQCERDRLCSEGELIDHIQALRTIMKNNRSKVAEAYDAYKKCLRK